VGLVAIVAKEMKITIMLRNWSLMGAGRHYSCYLAIDGHGTGFVLNKEKISCGGGAVL
jgi:hypothetical protein